MEVIERVLKEILNVTTKKYIVVYFSSEELEEIKKFKKDTSWHDFILEYIRLLKRAENNVRKGL